MDKIRIPSLIHYELVLQVLERQTTPDANLDPAISDRVKELIVTLRKALSQHKALEQACNLQHREIEHVWSLNSPIQPKTTD
jgi:hypothetical protein